MIIYNLLVRFTFPVLNPYLESDVSVTLIVEGNTKYHHKLKKMFTEMGKRGTLTQLSYSEPPHTVDQETTVDDPICMKPERPGVSK